MTRRLPRTDRTGPSRRQVLAGLGVSTLTLPLSLTAGCDLVALGTGDQKAPPSADELTLDEVTASTTALLAQVRASADSPAAGRRAPAITALGDALQAHLDRFTSDAAGTEQAPATAAPSQASSSAPQAPVAVAVLRQATQTHQALLQDAAARTTSGTFARLLAVAAAGVAQHLVPLSPAPKKDAAP